MIAMRPDYFGNRGAPSPVEPGGKEAAEILSSLRRQCGLRLEFERLDVKWGYVHHTVCHGKREYARDDDGDRFCEVHVNTMEGFWLLLRSWLRPHRGISQEKLPLHMRFFEFVHNVRRRGRALLGSLLDTLLQPVPCPQNPI